jgi:hypothetical protein
MPTILQEHAADAVYSTVSQRQLLVQPNPTRLPTMPTVLGVPIRAEYATTIDQVTDLELLIAFSNTVVWLLMSLLLYIQILENRRVEARLFRHLENERGTFAELNRQRREIMESWKQSLERIPEEDEPMDHEGRSGVVPEQSLAQRTELHVEDDLLDTMEDELLERRENDDDASSEGEDDLEMLRRRPARRQPDREHEGIWQW